MIEASYQLHSARFSSLKCVPPTDYNIAPKLSNSGFAVRGEAIVKITPTQKLDWLYAIMFAALGSLSYFPFINNANGVTLGIFKLE